MAAKRLLLACVLCALTSLSSQQYCPQDIVIILDRSGSLTSSAPASNTFAYWNLVKAFLASFVETLTYDVNNAQIGLVSYGVGDTAVVLFPLGQYQTHSSINNAIDNLDNNIGGRANVSAAFLTAQSMVLTIPNGERPTTPAFCLLIATIPPVLDIPDTQTDANLLKKSCRLLIVGIVADNSRAAGLQSAFIGYVSNQNTDYFGANFTFLYQMVNPVISDISATCPSSTSTTTTTTTTTTPTTTTTTPTTTTTTTTTTPTTTTTTPTTTTTTPTTTTTTPTTTTTTPTTTTTTPTTTPTTTITTTTTTTTTVPPSTLSPPTGCTGTTQANVVFILDSSGSIDNQDFMQILAFVASIVSNLNIDNGNIRVGLVTFSDNPTLQFSLTMYNTRAGVLAALQTVQFSAGTTNTAGALDFVRTQVFGTASTTRPNVAVLITDGGSNNPQATIVSDMAFTKAGIQLIVIGIGNWVNIVELKNLASYPLSVNLILVPNLSNFNAISQTLVALLCNNVNECSNNPCLNGGTCINGLGYYICQCPSTFAGVNCDKPCAMKANIVYAVDVSWSVSTTEFENELTLVTDLIFGVNVDFDSKVGLLFYAANASIIFNLGTTTGRSQTLNFVFGYYSGGITNITSAIVTARDQMFSPIQPNVQNILIILTNYQSPNIQSSQEEAMKARLLGITILVVAVGSDVSLNELTAIASYPVSQNIFIAPDFATATTLLLFNLTSSECNNINQCSSSPCLNGGTCVNLINGYNCQCSSSSTGINCERASSGIMDIVFAIDTSGSIRDERFEYILNFILTVVNNLEISPQKTQVGALQFNDSAIDQFDLNTYSTKQDVYWALLQTPFNGGLTNIASALQMLMNVKFTSSNGARSGVPHIALFFTDGVATTNKRQIIPSAVAARGSGIYIISYGTGVVDMFSLIEISSVSGYPVLDSVSQTVFTQTSYKTMPATLTSYLSSFVYDNPPDCNSNPCQNGGNCVNNVKMFMCQCSLGWSGQTCSQRCPPVLDIAVVLDLSNSDQFQEVLEVNVNFVRQLVLGLPIGAGHVAMAVVTFGNGANISFYLNTYSSGGDVLNALSFYPQSGPQSLDAALGLLTTSIFTTNQGSRSNAQHVAIVITDSDTPFDYSSIVNQATTAKSNSNAPVTIYAVLVGSPPSSNINMIDSIVTNTTSEYIYMLPSVAGIGSTVNSLLTTLCGG